MNQDAYSDYRQTVEKTMQGAVCKDIEEVMPQEPLTLIHLKVATISTAILQNKIIEIGTPSNKPYQNNLEAK